jgi:hypothetical protein
LLSYLSCSEILFSKLLEANALVAGHPGRRVSREQNGGRRCCSAGYENCISHSIRRSRTLRWRCDAITGAGVSENTTMRTGCKTSGLSAPQGTEHRTRSFLLGTCRVHTLLPFDFLCALRHIGLQLRHVRLEICGGIAHLWPAAWMLTVHCSRVTLRENMQRHTMGFAGVSAFVCAKMS